MPRTRPFAATTTVLVSALSAALLTLAQPVQAQSIIDNGSFDTDLAGWTSTGVTWSALGAAFLDDRADRLKQTFAVLDGQQYLLSFDYLSTGGPNANGLRLDFNGAGYATSVMTYAATSGVLTSETYAFTATADGNSVLRFLGTNRNTYLDNVVLSAVPENQSYLMMLAGLGAIGFMSRRRAGGDSAPV